MRPLLFRVEEEEEEAAVAFRLVFLDAAVDALVPAVSEAKRGLFRGFVCAIRSRSTRRLMWSFDARLPNSAKNSVLKLGKLEETNDAVDAPPPPPVVDVTEAIDEDDASVGGKGDGCCEDRCC